MIRTILIWMMVMIIAQYAMAIILTKRDPRLIGSNVLDVSNDFMTLVAKILTFAQSVVKVDNECANLELYE